MGLKVAVCVKQVPVLSQLKFDPGTKRVVREGVPAELNPFDVLAMSAACNLKRAMPAEIVVFTMGPPQAREVLVQCLAMGADRAVHLVDRAFAGSDTLATARALSLALQGEEFDLIICGLNSVDAETGQVGPEVAELLDLPLVTRVRRLEVNSSGRGLTAEQLTDVGYDTVYCPLPALISVTEGVAPEVYPKKEAIEAARSMPIVELAAADLSKDVNLFGLLGSPTWVSEIYSVAPHRQGIVVRDRPVEEAVGQLLDYLEKRGVFAVAGATGAARNRRGPRRAAGRRGAFWVVAELLDKKVRPVTLELLGTAKELAVQLETSVEVVLLGADVQGHVASLTAYGADTVHLAEDRRLEHCDVEVYSSVLAAAISACSPYAVLLPSTADGRDVAARLAARLGIGLTGDCVGLEIDAQGLLAQLKPAFGSNIVAPILSKTTPQMATVRPGMLTPVAPDWQVEPVVHRLSVEAFIEPRVKILERSVDRVAEGARLENARIVIGVGKGVGSRENIAVVRQLAEALGASLGATRDVTELGWLPRQLQIGLSGKAISPELYIAVGVRGAFNHTVGIQKAATVAAINNNPRAPIFKAADFGIVGDYAEVIPALAAAVHRRR